MRIANNIMALNTHRQYTIQNDKVAASAEKLSSGYRINRAADDAAGLAISEKMRSQIRGLNRASMNSQDAASLIQTAEGALQEVHSMLQRMNELAVQSATGTNQEFDRTQIAKEFDQLKREINDIAEQTTFNNMKILDGSLSNFGAQRSAATAGLFATNADSMGAAVRSIMNVSAIPGVPAATESFAHFDIDLTGMNATASGATDTFKLSIGGVDLTSAATAAYAANDTLDGAKIAALFAGEKVTLTIDGQAREFTAAVSGAVVSLTASDAKAWDISTDNLKTAVGTPTVGTTGATIDTQPNSLAIRGVQAGVADRPATAATNTYTFMGNVKAGDVFTFAGKRFELVGTGNPNPTTAGAIAVKMDVDNAATITALAAALQAEGGADYTITNYTTNTNGNAIEIAQADPAVPVDLSMSMRPAAARNGMVEFDPVKLKEGDKITVKLTDDNGDTQEVTYLHQEGNQMTDIAAILAGTVEGAERSGNFIKYAGKFVEIAFEETIPTDTETMRIQVGALENEQLSIEVRSMNTAGLGLDDSSIYTQDTAGSAITSVRDAVNTVSDQRALLGAMQNRMTYKINNIKISAENLQAAESRIRDVDIASEMTNFTKANIMAQAATAMLAQANSAPQNVLSLLR